MGDWTWWRPTLESPREGPARGLRRASGVSPRGRRCCRKSSAVPWSVESVWRQSPGGLYRPAVGVLVPPLVWSWTIVPFRAPRSAVAVALSGSGCRREGPMA